MAKCNQLTSLACKGLIIPPYVVYIGRDTMFTLPFFFVLFFFFMYTVTDFSAGGLPIGVKFCTAVRPHLGQVCSYFGDSPRDGRIIWASIGTTWRDMLLTEAFVLVLVLVTTFASFLLGILV